MSLTAGTTIKALNQAILAFYAHPATGRYGKSTTGQLATQALDCILSCRTRLVVVDFTCISWTCGAVTASRSATT